MTQRQSQFSSGMSELGEVQNVVGNLPGGEAVRAEQQQKRQSGAPVCSCLFWGSLLMEESDGYCSQQELKMCLK